MKMRPVLLIFLAVMACFSTPLKAQKTKKVTLSGIVTDAAGKPVAGVNIFIDKIKTDVITGRDGSYSIKIKNDAKEILAFSLYNGASEEQIKGRTKIDFVLDGNTKTVDRDKKVTENDKILNVKDSSIPVYQDIYDMIRGKVPGVEVSGKSIRIRGTNSLNVSTEPLFVVDGVITKEIDGIAPETVSSIEVLKGPDASVYGTRGSNGVILIKRRTGKD
jgi:TonB-dependent SusC/RagA subfamily outer membrane receptor